MNTSHNTSINPTTSDALDVTQPSSSSTPSKTTKLSSIWLRHILHFEWKSGLSPKDTTKNINRAYGERTMSLRCASSWFTRFADGDENLEDRPRQGRPVKVDYDGIIQRFKEAPMSRSGDLAKEFNTDHSVVCNILKKNGYQWKKDRWVAIRVRNRRKTKAGEEGDNHEDEPVDEHDHQVGQGDGHQVEQGQPENQVRIVQSGRKRKIRQGHEAVDYHQGQQGGHELVDEHEQSYRVGPRHVLVRPVQLGRGHQFEQGLAGEGLRYQNL